MITLTEAETISRLHSLTSCDNGHNHEEADEVLLAFVRGLGYEEVADAYALVRKDYPLP